MSFFFKANDNSGLNYDDTGFLHFITAISLALLLTLLTILFIDFKKWRNANSFDSLTKYAHFQSKIKLTKQVKKQTIITNGLIGKIAVTICLMIITIYCASLASQQTQLVGFDPYSILNIEMGAKQSQIKKAYRKLALQYHPDRNQNNPKAALQFILISKAYKCLTDHEAREQWQKSGNPDGEEVSRLGIGLPSFILQPQNKYLVLFVLLAVLLVLLPLWLMRWGKTQSSKKKRKAMIKNTALINSLMNPMLNDMGCCILIASMEHFHNLFPSRTLSSHQQRQFKNQIILQCPSIHEAISSISQKQLFWAYFICSYMKGQNNDLKIALNFPKLSQQLIQFASLFAKKSLDGKKLNKLNKILISWYGLIPLKRVIQFSRNIYNKKYNEICNSNNHNNDEIAAENPQLKLSAKITLNQVQVSQITTDDIAFIHIQLSPLNSNTMIGYCRCPNYPLIAEQHYILLISHNSNLLTHFIFKLQSPSHNFQHKIRLPPLPRKKVTLNVKVMSLSDNLNIQQSIEIEIFSKLEQRNIQYHPQDQVIQTIKFNFFQKLITFSKQNDSDFQLSDSESQKQDTEKVKKIKNSKTNFSKSSKKMGKIKKDLKLINKSEKSAV